MEKWVGMKRDPNPTNLHAYTNFNPNIYITYTYQFGDVLAFFWFAPPSLYAVLLIMLWNIIIITYDQSTYFSEEKYKVEL